MATVVHPSYCKDCSRITKSKENLCASCKSRRKEAAYQMGGK